MADRNGILIVVADGEHARFVQPAEDHALHTVASFDAISAHQRISAPPTWETTHRVQATIPARPPIMRSIRAMTATGWKRRHFRNSLPDR